MISRIATTIAWKKTQFIMNSMTDNLLAIDLGTSSVKVLITSAEGQVLSRGESNYPIDSPAHGYAEQNPESWWEATIQAVGQATAHISSSRDQIGCIGLSGQMHGTVLLNRNREPAAPAVIWPDRRSTSQAAELTDLAGSDRLIRLTGSPAATGFQAATVRWFQEVQPKLWSQVDKVLLPKDYLRWRIMGEFFTDPSDASGTLLFDINDNDWSERMLEIAGIEPNQLPPVVASNNIAGRVSTKAATALGVAKGTPVVTGAGDVACGLLGTGVTSDRRLLLTISTGGQITHPASNREVDVIGRIHTFRSAMRLNDEGLGYLRLGAILSAGRSLSWLRDQILQEANKTDFAALSARAETAPAGSDGLLFVPYIAGERTPHMNSEAKGMFLGMTIRHGRDHLIRAVMEGVALACYDAFSVLGEFGSEPELIVMAGGGARSLLWRQIVSDVFNLPVQSPVIWEQAALGAAMLAGSGIGIHDTNQAARAWPRYGPLIEPNLRRHERYQEHMDIFRSAYHAIQHSSE